VSGVLREGAAVLLAGVLRALLLSITALTASDVEAEARVAFVLSWMPIFGVLTLPMSLLERVIVRAVGALPPEASPAARRASAAFTAGVIGEMAGWLARSLLLAVRALEQAGPASFAIGGAAAALLLPPPPRPATDDARPSRIANAAPALLSALVLGGLFVASPETRYREKYARNRLSAKDLAAAPLFPERDVAALSDLEVARALAHTYMRTHPPATLPWSWEEAVAMEGLLAYARASGDAAPVDHARAWVDAHAEEALATTLYADSAAPALTVLALAEAGRARPPVDAPIVARIDRYLERDAPRTRAGVISHAGLLAFGLAPRQAWIDTLFMNGVYLERRALGLAAATATATATGASSDAIARHAESGRLAEAMLSSLEGPRDDGLYRHASIEVGPATLVYPVEGTRWARGNAWAYAMLVEHALAARALGVEEAPGLARRREGLARAFLAAQDFSGGLLSTDLAGGHGLTALETGHEIRNPFEVCASALVARTLRREARAGLRTGAAAEEARAAARRATLGVRGRIRWKGGHPSLAGTSIGTHPGFRAYYRAVPSDENVGHGVGAALLLLSEPE